MLQLGSRSITVDGITVYPDHADPDQFWYLPGPVQLARRGPDETPQFTLIEYRPKAVVEGVSGGGFLSFEVNLKLEPDLEQRILARLSSLAEGTPRLSVVPFDSGTVEVVALNVQGSGGTSADAAPGGSFNAVEHILGARTPSLQGDESAVFSLVLSEEGATILKTVFSGGGLPIGVIYDLKFTALSPALDVEITADFKRIHDYFRLGLAGGVGVPVEGIPVYVGVDIDLAFEKLKQDGAIKINVINASSAADRDQKEKEVLDFFKNNLLSKWFEPTLTPIQVNNSGNAGNPLGQIANQLGNLLAGASNSGNHGGTSSGSTNTGGSSSSDGHSGNGNGSSGSGSGSSGNSGSSSGSGSSGSSSGSSGSSGAGSSSGGGASSGGASGSSGSGSTGGSSSGPPHEEVGAAVTRSVATAVLEAAERQPASLTITNRRPDPLPQGYQVQHTPASAGTSETLTFAGGSAPPVVRVNGQEQSLSGRQLTLDVPLGTTLNIEADYSDTFHLYFDFDEPASSGWSVQPPGALYQSYLNNSANDTRFRASDGTENPAPNASMTGPNALRSWVRNELLDTAGTKQVVIDAYASFEGDDSPEKQRHNQDLTQRRRDAAAGVIGALAQGTGGAAHGHSVARDQGRVGDQRDRVVTITGEKAVVTAQLARPAAAAPAGGDGSHTTPTNTGGSTGSANGGTAHNGGSSNGGNSGSGNSGAGLGVSINFKLGMVKQEELKTLTISYHRSEAVQRSYAPQGLIGLLVDGLEKDKHFFAVDTDDLFFKKLAIQAEAPIQFQRIGLTSAQVAVDYGDPIDPADHEHADFVFSDTDPGVKSFSTFINKTFDTDYSYQVQYHFDPLSGWTGEKFAYDLPAQRTNDRTLTVNPFDTLGFMEIKLFPGEIDAGIVESTDVHLHYQDPGGWVTENRITVRPNSEPQFWRLRLSDPSARTYTYHFVHHLTTGAEVTGPEKSSQLTMLPVDDPFETALNLLFEPIFDPAAIKTVFIDVEYEDAANHYQRKERLLMHSDSTDAATLRIALLNAAQNRFRYRLTFLGQDNQVRRDAFVETDETLIFVGP